MSNQNVSLEVDLQKDGILWLINATVFHPRGLALAIHSHSRQFYLLGDGKEAWQFNTEDTDEGKERFDALLKRMAELNEEQS